jgi:CHASE3 domain sensor protein
MSGDRPISPWVGTAVVLLLVVSYGVTARLGLRSVLESNAWVAHSYEVKGALLVEALHLRTAESQKRGYVLTGDPKYLTLFDESRRRVLAQHDALLRLTADNRDQQRRLRRIHALVLEWFAEMDRVIATCKAQGQAAAVAVIREGEGFRLSERLAGDGAEMFDEEDRLLAGRKAAKAKAAATLEVTTLALMGSLVLFQVGFHLTLYLMLSYRRMRAS